MSSEQSQPTFLSVAPRFAVHDLEQALAFYGQLGFQTTYHDEAFAIVERDGVDLHLNSYTDVPKEKHSVCWIAVTNIDALYQQYLPTNAVQSPLGRAYKNRCFIISIVAIALVFFKPQHAYHRYILTKKDSVLSAACRILKERPYREICFK